MNAAFAASLILIPVVGYLSYRIAVHKQHIKRLEEIYLVESIENWAVRQAVAQRLAETLDHLRRNEENHEICDYIQDEMTKFKPMADLATSYAQEAKDEAESRMA